MIPSRFKPLGYFVASGISAATAFLSVGLMTRMLGVAEYGRWALLEPLFAVLANVALLGTNYGVIRFIAKEHLPAGPIFRRMARVVLPMVLGVAALASLVPTVLGFETRAIVAFGFAISFESLLILGFATLRAADRPVPFATIMSIRCATFLGTLSVSWHLGFDTAEAIIYCWLIAGVFGGLAVITTMRRQDGEEPVDRSVGLRTGANYGLPILVASFLVAPLSYLDRYALARDASTEVVGLYAVHVKVAAVLNPLLSTPLGLWWPAARFRHARDHDGGLRFFRMASVAAVAAYGAAGVGVWLAGPFLLELFAPGVQYDPSVLGLLLFALASVGLGHHVFNIGLFNVGKTKLNVVGAGSALVVLCVALVPLTEAYSSVGAAMSTAIGGLTYLVVTHSLSQRVEPVRLPYHLIGLTLLLVYCVGWGGAQCVGR